MAELNLYISYISPVFPHVHFFFLHVALYFFEMGTPLWIRRAPEHVQIITTVEGELCTEKDVHIAFLT